MSTWDELNIRYPEESMNEPAFEAGGRYLTRDGRRARIYATDGQGCYPIHGAILEKTGWQAAQWTPGGDWLGAGEPRPMDLVPPVQRQEFWVNCYPQGYLPRRQVHQTRALADANAAPARVACKRVVVEYVEGEFDEEAT